MALALVMTGTTYPVANADSLSDLKGQYNALQKQQQQVQQQLNDITSKTADENKKKDALDQSIKITKQQIAVLNQQISTVRDKLNAKNRDLAETQQHLDDNIKQYRSRMCSTYELGSASNLEILLSSKSVTDFLSKFEILQAISKHDNAIIDSLKKDQAQLASDKAAIQSDLSSYLTSQSDIASKESALVAQETQENQIIAQLNSNASQKKQQSAQISQQESQTDQEIDAEMAKRAQECAKQIIQNNGTAAASILAGGSQAEQMIVQKAEKYIGTPYVPNGSTPSGFDCSGFVQYVFTSIGSNSLPEHSAEDMSKRGTYVSGNNLQPGDLVFFATEGGRKVSHVGIYVGGGQFIASNSAGHPTGVSIQPLFDPRYWGPCFLYGRHII